MFIVTNTNGLPHNIDSSAQPQVPRYRHHPILASQHDTQTAMFLMFSVLSCFTSFCAVLSCPVLSCSLFHRDYLFLAWGPRLGADFTPLNTPISLKEFLLDVFWDPTQPTRVLLGEDVWDVLVRILPGSILLLNIWPPRLLFGKGGKRTSTSSDGPCGDVRKGGLGLRGAVWS